MTRAPTTTIEQRNMVDARTKVIRGENDYFSFLSFVDLMWPLPLICVMEAN